MNQYPDRKPLLCRLGLHKWSGYTWPIMSRVCFRCGAR